MKEYHELNVNHYNKDWESWSDVRWESEETQKPAVKTASVPAKPVKPFKVEKPRYKSWSVREADGSVTYYDSRINTKPVMIDGYMI